jgi:hypothetical protein
MPEFVALGDRTRRSRLGSAFGHQRQDTGRDHDTCGQACLAKECPTVD